MEEKQEHLTQDSWYPRDDWYWSPHKSSAMLLNQHDESFTLYVSQHLGPTENISFKNLNYNHDCQVTT
jgi:hypothetical protein